MPLVNDEVRLSAGSGTSIRVRICHFNDLNRPGRRQLTTHRTLKNLLLVCGESSKASEDGEASTTDEPGIFDCSWDEILQLLHDAKAEHNERGKRKIHKAFTLASRAIPWADRAVEMLPDQYGLSILRGGLKVIFVVSAD